MAKKIRIENYRFHLFIYCWHRWTNPLQRIKRSFIFKIITLRNLWFSWRVSKELAILFFYFKKIKFMIIYHNWVFNYFWKPCLSILSTTLITIEGVFLFSITTQQWCIRSFGLVHIINMNYGPWNVRIPHVQVAC